MIWLISYVTRKNNYSISFGALRGSLKVSIAPLEGVADKQQSGENWLCLQRQFMERLAWETGFIIVQIRKNSPLDCFF